MNTCSQNLISTKEYKKEDEQKVRNCILSKSKVCVFTHQSFPCLFFSIINARLCLIDLFIVQRLWAAARLERTFLCPVHTTLAKFENAALFSLRLGLPSIY